MQSQVRAPEKVPEKVPGGFGAEPWSMLMCFQRLASQHASERFVQIKRCGCWGYHRSFFFSSGRQCQQECKEEGIHVGRIHLVEGDASEGQAENTNLEFWLRQGNNSYKKTRQQTIMRRILEVLPVSRHGQRTPK